MLEHGGNLRQAAERFGRPLADWIDLSTGLNPHGYPAPAVAAAAWHRLPESDPALVAAACAYYGAPCMLAVAGTQSAIQALPALRPSSRVVVAAPSYAEHAHHWGMHGHTLRQVPYAALAAEVGNCDVMVVCNPNNPTGAVVPRTELLEWSAQLAARGGWLIVDEAFADTQPGMSVSSWASEPGLIVLRSIGKFFGLAGVRVGFVAAHEALLVQLADALGPWTVSGPAQQVAAAALHDSAWQRDTARRLEVEGRRLRTMLREAGLHSQGTALFQWWPEERAEACWEHMAKRGIWVRLFAHAARGIRIGLPADEAAWRALEQALREWRRMT
ncbi:threonine-phosphate decarboxylase CobD [Massilia sp. PAMC28688]|uniref:threonine-phosphate decarboxylase CobD n=1 Tax=Massilia sp. PAMC28688 TaxID=2861283 RepID=UPI001C628891|nr:threonine-phosphate decarboxylase CobD [Massilia sp. PAMC28688]QYF94598.1 threonine-phosphate decarboxylase CobD [Massilia sp. PAMC28688]